MGLTITSKSTGGLLGKLKGILQRSRDLTPLVKPVSTIIFEANRDRALRGVSFDGTAYAALAPSTIRDRVRHGYPVGPPLNRRGLMAAVINDLEVGVRPETARLRISKAWPNVKWMEYSITGTRYMPQRNPMGFSTDELSRISSLLPKHVLLGRPV